MAASPGSLTNSLANVNEGSAIAVLQSDVTDLQSIVDLLRTNISDIAFVDMDGDDYEMTGAEAECSIIVPSNVGDGTKALSWPASANGLYPSQQIIVTAYATNTFTIASSGFFNASICPSIATQVSVNGTVGALDIGFISRSIYNGEKVLGAGNTNLSNSEGGKTVVANDAVAQTLTVPSGLSFCNLQFAVSCEGAGGLTLVASGTSFVGGSPVFASGQSGRVQRIGLSEVYRILR